MEFGKVPDNQLTMIDFRLPAEPAGNARVLGGKRREHPVIYMGCPRWGTEGWPGKLYAPGVKEKEFIRYYPEHYNCIEFNATHYKIYEPEAIIKWRGYAEGHSFLFCPKMYNGVTHKGSLLDKQETLQEYFQSIRHFEKHLGPVFIQLSDAFSPQRQQELYGWLPQLPDDIEFFLEVRHPDWFAVAQNRSALFNALYKSNTGAVITDTAGRRDCVHMHITTTNTMVRFVANGNHPVDYKRADEWVQRIDDWFNTGLQTLYFFVHVKYGEFLPELTSYLAEQLTARCGIPVHIPEMIAPSADDGRQIGLFD